MQRIFYDTSKNSDIFVKFEVFSMQISEYFHTECITLDKNSVSNKLSWSFKNTDKM